MNLSLTSVSWEVVAGLLAGGFRVFLSRSTFITEIHLASAVVGIVFDGKCAREFHFAIL